jgi:hypothetical protein
VPQNDGPRQREEWDEEVKAALTGVDDGLCFFISLHFRVLLVLCRSISCRVCES